MMTHSAGSSSLSSLSENELPAPFSPVSNSTISDEDHDHLQPAMPPAKKRRRNTRNQTPNTHTSPAMSPAPSYDDLSSDTEGSVPPSPRPHAAGHPATQDEYALAAESVHVCQWEGCNAGDLGNQDELVQHVQDAHVTQNVPRQKITCEWLDCKTKGKTQSSAYGLKGHMKSHTKDKPHYCSLPECDRSFTRADALTKHMRTVHDSESLRTTEHYPKPKTIIAAQNDTPASGNSPAPSTEVHASVAQEDIPLKPPPKLSLKLLLSGKEKDKDKASVSSTSDVTAAEPQSPISPSRRDEAFGAFPATCNFTDAELALDRKELFELLRRQIKWAEEDATELAQELEVAERRQKQEWFAKELVLENLLEADVLTATDQGLLTYLNSTGNRSMDINWNAVRDATKLPLSGKVMPWYRKADRRPSLDHVLGVPARTGPIDGRSIDHTSRLAANAEDVDDDTEMEQE